jgi:hypothetical protein
MDEEQIRRRIAASRLAPLAALPTRIRMVARYETEMLGRSARWLLRSREHTNLTYHLSDLNREHLAWFVATVATISAENARAYMAELEDDKTLAAHICCAIAISSRHGLADAEARYGRRLGWYALVRAFRPEHVVETGTDKGLGSCVLAAALLRNETGRLTTIDINPAAGYLIQPPYSDVVDLRVGDSLDVLRGLDRPVHMFVHDSDHSPTHEAAEFAAITPHLAPEALVLSDNAHGSAELPRWAEAQKRPFLFFREEPAAHWYPGGGIGAAGAPRSLPWSAFDSCEAVNAH